MIRSWDSVNVLITGGLGFIGSNLAHELHSKNANVKIYDCNLPKYGGNMSNISSISDELSIIDADIRNKKKLMESMEGIDVIYHCAAQLSRPISNERPKFDAEINALGTINILESAASLNSVPHLVFMSSQAVAGRPPKEVIDEDTELKPTDIYGVHKSTAEHYCRIYNNKGEVRTTSIRLSNVYGPRAKLKNSNYGVINRFIKQSLCDKSLTVFKPGNMERDFIFIDDVISALTRIAKMGECSDGEIYAVGTGKGTSIKDLAEKIVRISGKGDINMVEWPDKWENVKVGNIRINPEKIQEELGWEANVSLENGLKKTISFYEKNRLDYF